MYEWVLIIHVFFSDTNDILEGTQDFSSQVQCELAMESATEVLDTYLINDEEVVMFCMKGEAKELRL